jgi:hypothetical protein
MRKRIVRKWIGKFKQGLKKTAVYPLLRDARILLGWMAAGRPVPPPHLVKQRAIRRLARRFHLAVFIETGTYRGDMVEAVRDDFDRVYSIELGAELCRRARERFAGDERIVLLQGDSGEILGDLLRKINRPCLFWLDSHFSDADTARSGLITPVLRELEHIFRHELAGRHVILIDDARLFNGEDDYPTLETVKALAENAGFESIDVRDDMIRIRNNRGPGGGSRTG